MSPGVLTRSLLGAAVAALNCSTNARLEVLVISSARQSGGEQTQKLVAPAALQAVPYWSACGSCVAVISAVAAAVAAAAAAAAACVRACATP